LTLVVHCLSRTPSTKKSQLASNYSALTLKFGALEATRASARNHFVIPSQNPSENFQVKDIVSMEEARNFPIDMSPFMMDRSYQSVVKVTPTFEPVNFSHSQQTTTTTTTLSRENSMKFFNLKKVYSKPSTNPNGGNSFAEKLKKCTQILTFKSDASSSKIDSKKIKLRRKISNDSHKSGRTVSNSSLKDIDEEASSELAQMMSNLNKGFQQMPVKSS
jgi:hypothetical protein